MEPAGQRAISEYRITCVVRRADGHVRAVGYSEDGNSVMYDDLWTLDEARHAIQQGHRLFAVSPSTGVEAGLRLWESRDLDLVALSTGTCAIRCPPRRGVRAV